MFWSEYSKKEKKDNTHLPGLFCQNLFNKVCFIRLLSSRIIFSLFLELGCRCHTYLLYQEIIVELRSLTFQLMCWRNSNRRKSNKVTWLTTSLPKRCFHHIFWKNQIQTLLLNFLSSVRKHFPNYFFLNNLMQLTIV